MISIRPARQTPVLKVGFVGPIIHLEKLHPRRYLDQVKITREIYRKQKEAK